MSGVVSDDRLSAKIREAHDILDEAWWQHVGKPDKQLVGVVCLFSGGDDSTVLAHLMRERVSHYAHANTTIGIEETRQFVRDCSRLWGVPLIEETATGPDAYEALVLDQGFPGPGHHWKMFQRLKEHQLDKVRRQLVTHSRRQRVIFVAGRRKEESQRRKRRWRKGELVEHERDGSTVWCSPLLHWTKADLVAYREAFDVPLNEVSAMIHMSGECLCGAFASPGEREEVGFFFPEWEQHIRDLEQRVKAAGHPEPRCVWGWGAAYPDLRRRAARKPQGPLCDSCPTQGQLFDRERAS